VLWLIDVGRLSCPFDRLRALGGAEGQTPLRSPFPNPASARQTPYNNPPRIDHRFRRDFPTGISARHAIRYDGGEKEE
jgi:hypothetical protein